MSRPGDMADLRRIKWQCRRGMLELDLLLQGFVANGYNRLDKQEQDVFLRILDVPDQELLELLMGRITHRDACINELARKIRTQHNH